MFQVNDAIENSLHYHMRDITPDDKCWKFKDVLVKSTHYGHISRWIGPQKNVHFWVILENGYAVGWNENPARGWSFPVAKVKL